MIWEDLNEDLILLQETVVSKEEVFQIMGQRLINLGYCKESYITALNEREKDYPTGIGIGDFGIAMPHTDSSHVLKETEMIMTLKEPVTFVQMGTLDVQVQVRIILMLAIQKPQEHIVKLQRIIELIKDQDLLRNIYTADSKQQIINLIQKKEIEIEEVKKNEAT